MQHGDSVTVQDYYHYSLNINAPVQKTVCFHTSFQVHRIAIIAEFFIFVVIRFLFLSFLGFDNFEFQYYMTITFSLNI